jgi:hypothetical protein
MPIVKLSCEYCKKNHTCKAKLADPPELKQVHVYKITREQARKEKIERSKPVVKKEKIEFNVIS